MNRILIYSGLLLAGIVCSQVMNIEPFQQGLQFVTMISLAYIMIEVGLEFTIDKKKIKNYGLDAFVSASAAVLPWLFCAAYFICVLKTDWKLSLLVGCFAAPTSAGILFTMLAAAGLRNTWIFKKAQVLAIFDDLFTIMLLIPLKILFMGLKPELFIVLPLMVGILWVAYLFLHRFYLPIGKPWLLLYGIFLSLGSLVLKKAAHIHLEVLLPAFSLGCLLHTPQTIERKESRGLSLLDTSIKSAFMFLVGCLLPKLSFGEIGGVGILVMHVLWISILANLGKCFPLLFYKNEAGFKERLALCVAMFPRGEVGGGVLLIALGYGLNGLPATIASLSLALNLILIGVFIVIVKWLINGHSSRKI